MERPRCEGLLWRPLSESYRSQPSKTPTPAEPIAELWGDLGQLSVCVYVQVFSPVKNKAKEWNSTAAQSPLHAFQALWYKGQSTAVRMKVPLYYAAK